MPSLLVGSALALSVCPWLSEVHADPNPLADSLGEFLELVQASSLPTQAAPLTVLLDGDTLAKLPSPEQVAGARTVFCHPDTLWFDGAPPIACQRFHTALVNSRPLDIVVIQGGCRDSVVIPAALPGKSWQRDSLGAWRESDPSPGFAQPLLEAGACNLKPSMSPSTWDGSAWELQAQALPTTATPCLGDDSLFAIWKTLEGTPYQLDTLLGSAGTLRSSPPGGPWAMLELTVHGDDVPLDNTTSALLSPPSTPPLRITEAAPCPAAGWPEWWEFTNVSTAAIPLSALSNCAPLDTLPQGTLAPGLSCLLTDSRQRLLSAFPAASRSPILQSAHSLGLSNSGDTIRLCLWGHAVDSVHWRALGTADCGASLQRSDDTLQRGATADPGWTKASTSASFTSPRLESRIVSIGNESKPLRLTLPNVAGPWRIRLIDRSMNAIFDINNLHSESFLWSPGKQAEPGPYLLLAEPLTAGTSTLPLRIGVVLVP